MSGANSPTRWATAAASAMSSSVWPTARTSSPASTCCRSVPSCPPAPVISQRMGLLAVAGVARLDGFLLRTPPRLVLGVPADRVGQAGAHVGEARRPAEFPAQLRRVDRVPQVVPGPVGDL